MTPEVARVINEWKKLHEDWNSYFELEEKLYADAIKKGARKGDPIYAKIRQELAVEYPKHARNELEFIDTLRDGFIPMMERQFPGIDTAPIKSYWDEVRATAEKRQNLMMDWRNILAGAPLGEIADLKLRAMVQQGLAEGGTPSSMWPKFWTEHYMPVIGEGYLRQGGLLTEHTRTVAEYRPGAAPAVEAPLPVDLAEQAIANMHAEQTAKSVLAEFETGKKTKTPLVDEYLLTDPAETLRALNSGEPVPVADAARAVLFRPGTPEFDSWFGGSKVVDEQGNPLTLYHATL
jgi:hypothetical protein